MGTLHQCTFQLTLDHSIYIPTTMIYLHVCSLERGLIVKHAVVRRPSYQQSGSVVECRWNSARLGVIISSYLEGLSRFLKPQSGTEEGFLQRMTTKL